MRDCAAVVLPMTLALTLTLIMVGHVLSESFVDTGFEARRIQRDLLQTEGEEESSSEKKIVPEKEEYDEPVEISRGPTRFYFENGKMPKILLTVEEGIVLTVFKDGRLWDKFMLDKEATGGITGSKVNPEKMDFQVDIDWKAEKFSGQMDPSNVINGLQIEMTFGQKKNSFHLTNLRVVQLAVGGSFETVELHVSTKYGYAVEAPLGLAFGCSNPGMFGPLSMNATRYSAGLTFPDMTLQVYKVKRGKFGPIWDCGELMSIGVWVGLLVTLFLASICIWGFSMLANINTMDRFDDPKGKTIYVPQTD